MTAEQDRRIVQVIEEEGGRLRSFIRKRVGDALDAEDILQEAFSELVEAYRLMKPIEEAGAWLFRVARNRIVDLFRRRKAEPWPTGPATEDGERLVLEDILPSAEAGPDAAYARAVLFEELEAALDELPDEQREVFLAHEVEGRSFREISRETAVGINTLLSRKHYAVLRLRRRLSAIREEFT